MLFAVLITFVFFAGLAMTINEGLWSNTISLICILLAGLLAWYWGLVLGGMLMDQVKPSPENAWYFLFATVWGVFFFAVTILRIAADRISRVRMRFIKPVDMGGGIVMGIAVAVMFTSFTALSLFIPFTASAWKVQEAAPWQRQVISQSAAPMFSVLVTFYGDEFAAMIVPKGS